MGRAWCPHDRRTSLGGVRVTDLDRGSGPLRSSRRRTQQDIHDGDCPSSLGPRSRWFTSAAGPHSELISYKLHLRYLHAMRERKLVPYTHRKNSGTHMIRAVFEASGISDGIMPLGGVGAIRGGRLRTRPWLAHCMLPACWFVALREARAEATGARRQLPARARGVPSCRRGTFSHARPADVGEYI